MASRSAFLFAGLTGLLLTACVGDRPPLLEDDPRSRAAQRQARAVPPPLPHERPQPVPVPVFVPAAPEPAREAAPAPSAARAPFRAPGTPDGAERYRPRPPQVEGAPDDAGADLDADPYFAGTRGPDAPPRIGAPARVGADAGPDRAPTPARPVTPAAPYALRGDAAPAAPPAPARPAVRETPRLSRALPQTTGSDRAAPVPAQPAFLPDPDAALAAVNAYRARYGYAPLAYSPVLSQVARDHAQELAARGAVTSVSAEGDGVTNRLAARGYDAGAAASLVAGGYDAFGDALASWRGDRVQRSRLLLPQATEIGIARVEDPRSPYRYYIELIVAME